jgi:hypothetical protein
MLYHVLLFGHDTTLLRTRKLILENVQFSVEIATNAAELERALAGRPAHLLILCHSLGEPDLDRSLVCARRAQPSIKTLLLYTSSCKLCAADPDGIFCVFDGPEALVAAARQLLDFPPLPNPPLPNPQFKRPEYVPTHRHR